MRLEQTFINERGLPFRKYWKNVIYSPDYHNSNEGKVFSGLNYLLEKCNEESDPTNQTKLIEEFKKHISIIRFHLNSAKHLMRQTFSQ